MFTQRVVLVQAAGHQDDGGWRGRRSPPGKIQKWLSVFLSFMILCKLWSKASSDHLSGSRGRTKAPAEFLDAQNSSYQADPLSAKFLRVLISLVHHFSSSRKHTKCLNSETLVSHWVTSVPIWVSCLFQYEVTYCGNKLNCCFPRHNGGFQAWLFVPDFSHDYYYVQ